MSRKNFHGLLRFEKIFQSLNTRLRPALFSLLLFFFSACSCAQARWRQNHDGSMKHDRQKLKSMVHMGSI